ncbi:MAG TPA: thioredoxin family protein [Thiohalobacter sp.]|nr:thioredoxin family protein [Thiohalobacter sp.]
MASGVWRALPAGENANVLFPPSATAVHDYPRDSAIDWLSWNPQAREQARRTGKGLFVYFHGQWCTWCRRYQSETLEHPGTVAAIEARYVPVLVNLDQRRDLFTRLGGRGVPYTVLMDATGQPLARFTGHVSAVDLQQLLQETAEQVITAAAVPAGLQTLLEGDPETFLAFLDETYDPTRQRLSGASIIGALSKRPQPLTYLLLLREPAWAERIPGMLDVLREELFDPVDGGFFFFHDSGQAEPADRTETSKLLGLNAKLIWLFAESYHELGREPDARVVRESLNYLRTVLWDESQDSFAGSQASDPEYYAASLRARAELTPPPVERVQYADVSGQAIIALIRAARALDEPGYLRWAGRALAGLDARLRHPDGGYYHYRPEGGVPQLAHYLPAQVWPAAAWWLYYAATGDAQAKARGAQLLEHIAAYYDASLGGFAERLAPGRQPWTESRTHAALAWLLVAPAGASVVPAALLSPERREVWLRAALDQLQLVSGGDPDDMALGVAAQRRVGGQGRP